ncbi:hypothetical protein SASPL_140090 [Salvia splendens]|uniref:J domain-containing protein n=1 Tax=Salvia splendens TaxID=180675 RepID=A0A8X8ZBM0_SALSN|nr:hypothetical protein SASPL_140090 [Salvia splendens]
MFSLLASRCCCNAVFSCFPHENADYDEMSPFVSCHVVFVFIQAALQLHPDKNSNSMAEAAFKLVSEAYLCLSDTTRRREFDTERKTMSCIKCNPNSSKRTDPPPLTNSNNNATTPKPTQASRNSRIRGRVRELRAKLAEESTIINRCLMANAAASAAKALGAQKESPVFDPSDYPHHRTARLEEQPSEWETETCTMEQFMTTQYSSV